MRSALALVRAAWLSALSYRLATVLSMLSVAASIIPIFFVAGAVQAIAAESIHSEGGNYFGFVIVGLAAIYLLSAAVAAIPAAIGGGIGNGTFEALLVTRTPLPLILAGLSGYPMLQSTLRAAVLLVGGVILGVEFNWSAAPTVAGLLLLMVLAYAGIGLVAAALVLAFRTSGPLITATVALSGLLGGAYYSTSVVPGWLSVLTDVVPLTYALRPIRMLLLGGASLADVVPDVLTLTLFTTVLLIAGGVAFRAALRRARSAGTLSQY